ncbi:UDP-glucose 4-epimerase GalE [Thiomicrorhabdus sp. 6S2-11]|uniref:UDP-glucose 4-epimerase n=1 Tax=Thiomicrorhabdus marina TaxID=2818442 RepID=A0ABS3Q1W1_9GAMM|nr:UDP-glucose 4-epimerase GalE [Thiomicrorhabdus marina]MBO1926310.1 UDP-glucose 4-epimerase GalE [Thiomicrorhabdus marina]
MSFILVTGGAGYIGSHTCIELLANGQSVIVLDNLSNSSLESMRRVAQIADVELQRFEQASDQSRFVFVQGDIRDLALLRLLFAQFSIESVVHFAGLKAVGESVEKPLMYYDNNVSGSVKLLEVMAENDCKNIVFSSSATVYGDPASVPISEDFPLSTTNPYGASKLMVENIMRDLIVSDDSWSIALLRYFNPVGAHESGLIGEDPNGIPNNLMPFVAQVAVGKREQLSVFGGDYSTHDGTGVRDYIHVVDLAKGHLKALEALRKQQGVLTVNLGTGQGYSVLDMVKAFEKVSNRPVKYQIVERRPGDVAQCYANPDYAYETLGWKAEFGIERMCADAWRWQSQNPNGYRE